MILCRDDDHDDVPKYATSTVIVTTDDSTVSGTTSNRKHTSQVHVALNVKVAHDPCSFKN